MLPTIRCLLINYDGSSQLLLEDYIRRAGCQEVNPATSPTGWLENSHFVTDYDLIFLHLTSPEEFVRQELATWLCQHRGLVITSPFPRHQFRDLLFQPFAFLNEPFSFAQFSKCLVTYSQRVGHV